MSDIPLAGDDRKIHIIKDIVIKCSFDDGTNSTLDGLALTIMHETAHRRLGFTKVSTTTWKQDNDVHMFVPEHGILVVASSEGFGDLGHVNIETSDCPDECAQTTAQDGIQPGNRLERTFEPVENAPRLSLSYEVHILALEDILGGTLEGHFNPYVLYDIVQQLPDDDPIKVNALHSCGDQFEKTFRMTQNEGDIRAAIKAYEDAAGSLLPDDPRFIRYMNDVGLGYRKCFQRVGRVEDIAAAISIWRQTLAMTPDGHTGIPTLLFNLAISLTDRFKSTGRPADISEAIEVQQRAIHLTPDASGHGPELRSMLSNLGNSLMRRFKLTDQLTDISDSIQTLQRAVHLTPDGHEELATTLSNLGNAFSDRFERTGELADLSESILHQQRALQLTPDGHDCLPGVLSNLGLSFSLRFQATGDVIDISQAIQLQQRALQLASDGHADLSAFLTNLGKALLHRFLHTGELTDISEAIQVQQRSRQLTPDDDPELPNQLNNLGTLIMARFECTRDLVDLSEAIRVQQHAVSLTPLGHAALPGFLGNLGRLFFRRFEYTTKLTDVSEAIQVLQHAVRLIPDGHPHLTDMLHILGISFLCRFKRTDNPADISQAFELMQRAFRITPEGHPELSIRANNLGRLYLFSFERSRDRRLFDSALSAFRSAAMSSTGPPSMFMTAAKRWAKLSKTSLAPPSELLDAHEHVIRLLSLNTGLENTFKRRHELLLDSSQLSTTAAAAALSVNQLDKALEWLEQGRCIVWNQINQLRTPLDDLHDHNPALAGRFSLLSRQLENAGSRSDPRDPEATLSIDVKVSSEKEAHNHLKLAKERDELLKTIRNLPGFDSFLQPKKCADLMRGLPDEGPIIIINADKDRCDALALIADCDEPMHIPLERCTYEQVTTLAQGLRSYLSSYRLRTRYSKEAPSDPRSALRHNRRGAKDDLQKMLSTLWTDLVEPILQALAIQVPDDNRDLPRIWWCPTGPFAFLPIHAAGIYNRGQSTPGSCLTDFAVSSYIPTLSILTGLRSRTDPCTTKKGVLLVSQPDTPGLTEIPSTVKEVEQTHEQLDKGGVRSALYNSKKATINVISESMESYSCIHLACHASQEITNPLESAIHLYDGPLKLSEIMKKNLPDADLAFMSACQTSVGDEKLPEEAVHLAAGMLAAGYRSVVATMWSISDQHAPQVAETFYENLLNDLEEGERLNGTRSARALHTATRHLREKLGDSTEALLAWIPYIHVGI